MDNSCNNQHQISLAMVDPATIRTNPQAYQFRKAINASGVTEEYAVEGTKWDPILHGDPIIVHERLDGSRYVADGHHRLNKAQTLQRNGNGPDKMAAMILKEADGYTVEDARLVAAYKNIEQGGASALEVARIFKEVKRDTAAGKVHADLLPELSMNKPHARMGYEMSNLSDNALAEVEMGRVPEMQAAMIAMYAQDAPMQEQLMREASNLVQKNYDIPSMPELGYYAQKIIAERSAPDTAQGRV